MKQYKTSSWLRFLLFSLAGIYVFFINCHVPEYQFRIGVWEWGKVAGQSNVLVSHATNLIKAALFTGNFPVMPFVVWLIGVYSVVDLFWLRPDKFWHTTRVAAVFAVFKIVGFLLLCFAVAEWYTGWNPFFMDWFFHPVASLGEKSICQFIMNNILVTICISIPAASLFLPLLVDYGLVDFVGVLVRPIMRPVFRLPGRAAVIMVSAFLGNFSVGHIAVNDQYKTGRMTEREAVVIGTSFSTVSVGFLLVLANNTGLNERGYWNLYFWTAFLITLLVSLIGVRIYPLRQIADTFYPRVSPNGRGGGAEDGRTSGVFGQANRLYDEGNDWSPGNSGVRNRLFCYGRGAFVYLYASDPLDRLYFLPVYAAFHPGIGSGDSLYRCCRVLDRGDASGASGHCGRVESSNPLYDGCNTCDFHYLSGQLCTLPDGNGYSGKF